MVIPALIGREILRWRKKRLDRLLASLLGVLLRNVIWQARDDHQITFSFAVRMACGDRKLQHLNHALTIDDSRKGRHLSHKMGVEKYRSRQEAVAGKVCECVVLHGWFWVLKKWKHLRPQLKAERRSPWGHNKPKESDNYYVLRTLGNAK